MEERSRTSERPYAHGGIHLRIVMDARSGTVERRSEHDMTLVMLDDDDDVVLDELLREAVRLYETTHKTF